jgi:DNA-binding response OmpR family regulator
MTVERGFTEELIMPRNGVSTQNQRDAFCGRVRRSFELIGMRVMEVDSCRTATRLAVSGEADAIIAEFELTDGDGFDLLTAIRKSGATVPIILMPVQRDMRVPATGSRGKNGAARSAPPGTAAAATAHRDDSIPTVMLVESDEVQRLIHRRELEAAGLQVVAVHDGYNALLSAHLFPGRLDLLVTEVHLTGLSGLDLWRKLARDRPELGVVFLAGPRDDVAATIGPGGNRNWHVLRRPFEREALVKLVVEKTASLALSA